MGTSAEPTVGDAVTTRLTELGVEPTVIEKIRTDLGATSVDDLAGLNESDLVGAGMKALPARNLVAKLRKAAAEAAAPAASAVSTMSFEGVLPAVPDDTSWLAALRAGGVLKVDQSTVISAVRAGLAHRVGLFEVPDLLVAEMERFSDANEEQVDPEFFKLRKMLTRKSYGDIFEAIEGLEGSYVTEGRKKELFSRLDGKLWPAIISFNGALKAWQEAWMQGAANPAIMMSAIFAASGTGGGAMPPGMMQPPDTGVLRDNAAAVADAVNRVFAGTGVQIAAALAYEASRIKETLTNPRLPALIGAANRDQMLRQLGVAVSATYPRLEMNLTKFVLAVLQAQDQPAGNEELQYFGAMYMLGSQIPWEQLGSTGKPSGIGGGRRL